MQVSTRMVVRPVRIRKLWMISTRDRESGTKCSGSIQSYCAFNASSVACGNTIAVSNSARSVSTTVLSAKSPRRRGLMLIVLREAETEIALGADHSPGARTHEVRGDHQRVGIGVLLQECAAGAMRG